MKDKIAIFYVIAQIRNWWEDEFYTKQINRLTSSGLYDQIEFIDIMVGGGYKPLPSLPSKVRDVMYLQPKGLNVMKFHKHIWNFCHLNPDYKVLFFHSLGVSYENQPESDNKLAYRDYLEFFSLDHWKECTELLNHYDCVGNEYNEMAVFYPQGFDWSFAEADETKDLKFKDKIKRFYSPHFQGGFWWANSNYIGQLDPTFLDQNVYYKNYLNELWVCSKPHKAYSFYDSGLNHYVYDLNFFREDLISKTQNHINYLNKSFA
jgi:hypothetical protein